MDRFVLVCSGCGWESTPADMRAVAHVAGLEHLTAVHAAAIPAGTAPSFRVHTVQEVTASELETELASQVEPETPTPPPPANPRPEPRQHPTRGGTPRRKG